MRSGKAVAIGVGAFATTLLLLGLFAENNPGWMQPTPDNAIPDGLTPREWWHVEDVGAEHGIGSEDTTALSEAVIAAWEAEEGWPRAAACSIYYTRDDAFIRETLADHATSQPEAERAVWIETTYYMMGHDCRAPEKPAPI